MLVQPSTPGQTIHVLRERCGRAFADPQVAVVGCAGASGVRLDRLVGGGRVGRRRDPPLRRVRRRRATRGHPWLERSTPPPRVVDTVDGLCAGPVAVGDAQRPLRRGPTVWSRLRARLLPPGARRGAHGHDDRHAGDHPSLAGPDREDGMCGWRRTCSWPPNGRDSRGRGSRRATWRDARPPRRGRARGCAFGQLFAPAGDGRARCGFAADGGGGTGIALVARDAPLRELNQATADPA